MITVAEEFYSLQGEGRHTGMAAYFVRLAGCDVGCPWCDSREAWGGGRPVDEAAVAARAAASGARAAVVTGGEPLMQNLDKLTAALHAHGLAAHLETSGTHPLSGNFDWICLSPKRHRPPLFFDADELKIVVATRDDLAWAEECAARAAEGCRLYLQPEWGSSAVPVIVEYILQNPRWRLSLQTHKYLNIP
jgi:organic radical activating enzyme